MPSTSSKILASAIGRRKSAIASVRLQSGSGDITVNGKPAEQYFPGPATKIRYQQPFVVTNTIKKYSATVKTNGGGPNGQLDATVLGIARCLADIKADYTPLLRKSGLLTRDPRTRQRRMVGMGGKSRRRKQSPKR